MEECPQMGHCRRRAHREKEKGEREREKGMGTGAFQVLPPFHPYYIPNSSRPNISQNA